VDYYADAERGDHVADPDHDDLLALIGALNTTDNTFFVVYPDDEQDQWFISVTRGANAFGAFTIERSQANGTTSATTAADPVTIATDVKAWADAQASNHFRNTP
jgi:hypothetical protein